MKIFSYSIPRKKKMYSIIAKFENHPGIVTIVH